MITDLVARLRQLGVLAGSRALVAVLGMAAAVLLARALGPEGLGRWALMMAWLAYLLQLSELGLRSVMVSEAARAPERARASLRRYLALRLLASLALAITALGIAWASGIGTGALALLLLLVLPAFALQFDWIALARGRLVAAGLLLNLRPLVWVIFLAAAAPLAVDLTALAWGYGLAAWTAAVASWPLVARLASGRREAPMPCGELLRRGLPLCAVNLTNELQQRLDLVVLGWAAGAAWAGRYYLASALLVAGLWVANAANQGALGRFAPYAGRPRTLARELVRELVLVLAVAGAIAASVLLFGELVLIRLFGPAFASAAPVLAALLPWFVLHHASALLQGALAATRREREALWGNLVMLGALVAALPFAALTGDPLAFAAARGAAEGARLLWLSARLFRSRNLERLQSA